MSYACFGAKVSTTFNDFNYYPVLAKIRIYHFHDNERMRSSQVIDVMGYGESGCTLEKKN